MVDDIAIIELLRAGWSQRAIERIYHMSYGTIYKWLKKRGKTAEQMSTLIITNCQVGRIVCKPNELCFSCTKSGGLCPWSAIDPATERPGFKPIEGWIVEVCERDSTNNYSTVVECNVGYHILYCPERVYDGDTTPDDGTGNVYDEY